MNSPAVNAAIEALALAILAAYAGEAEKESKRLGFIAWKKNGIEQRLRYHGGPDYKKAQIEAGAARNRAGFAKFHAAEARRAYTRAAGSLGL